MAKEKQRPMTGPEESPPLMEMPFKAAEPVEPPVSQPEAAPPEPVKAVFPKDFADIAEAPKDGRIVKLWFGGDPKTAILAKWRQSRKWDKGWKVIGFWAHPYNQLKLPLDAEPLAFALIPSVTQEDIELSNAAVHQAEQSAALRLKKRQDEADKLEQIRHAHAVAATESAQ